MRRGPALLLRQLRGVCVLFTEFKHAGTMTEQWLVDAYNRFMAKRKAAG
jgi:hypothetical protein